MYFHLFVKNSNYNKKGRVYLRMAESKWRRNVGSCGDTRDRGLYYRQLLLMSYTLYKFLYQNDLSCFTYFSVKIFFFHAKRVLFFDKF